MICAPKRENGNQVAAAARKPLAADLFRHARPWQFPGDGRKSRLIKERERRLTRCCAGFDRTMSCENIYPAVDTILRRLRETELVYPAVKRKRGRPISGREPLAWSRRTVFRYLARLEKAGIVSRGGLNTQRRNTRRRVLHPDKLLFSPVQSGTPQCGTQSSSPRKFHTIKKKRAETHAAAKTAAFGVSLSEKSSPLGKRATPLPSATAAELRQPARAVEFLNLFGIRYPQQDERWHLLALAWALRKTKGDPDCQRKIFHPVEYVIGCIDNFLSTYPDHQQRAILERFDLPGVCYYGSQWMPVRKALEAHVEANHTEPREEDLIKIAFVHAIVEEAARRGVPAIELLAERLEAEKPSRPEAPRRAQSEAIGPQHHAESPDAGCIKSAAPQSPTPGAWMDKYKRVICPDCGVSVLHWALEDGLHRKVCPGRGTSP